MTKKEIIEKYGEKEYQRRLEYQKQYDQEHKDEINEQQKQYYQQNREERKQYYQQNREERKQYQKQYDQEHKDERKQYKRKHRFMFVYCIPEEWKQIENYELAKADNFDGWCIHHRLETHNSDGEKRLVNLSRTELKALDMYYNRPANELIFLTISEHTKLHRKKQS